MVRFILFLIFMAGILTYGLLHLVLDFNNNPSHTSKMVATLIVSLVILVPDIIMTSSMGKSDLGTTRARIILGIFFIALLLDFPTAFGWSQFSSDSYWLQIPAEVAVICFAPAAVALRVRQKFWRRDWSPKK
jgi:hypothetical protein